MVIDIMLQIPSRARWNHVPLFLPRKRGCWELWAKSPPYSTISKSSTGKSYQKVPNPLPKKVRHQKVRAPTSGSSLWYWKPILKTQNSKFGRPTCWQVRGPVPDSEILCYSVPLLGGLLIWWTLLETNSSWASENRPFSALFLGHFIFGIFSV